MRGPWKGFGVFACVVTVLAGTIAILNRPPFPTESLDPLALEVADGAEPAASPRPLAVAPRARDIERMVFTGVSGFDQAEVRRALHADFDLALAAHPGKDLFEYLALLEKTVTTGYRHCGFPDASIEVLYNHTRERVEVRVEEGPRFRCGDLTITGNRLVPTEAIVEALTQSSSTIRTLWKPECAAPFDVETRDELRRIVREAHATVGCFSPEFDIEIRRQPDSGTAALAVTIRDEGPQTVVGRIEVPGAKRDSTADIVRFLELEPGMPFGTNLTRKLAARLRESGRFLAAVVKRGEAAAEAEAGKRVQAMKIEVVEYPQAPALNDELSAVDQALLRFGEWMERWSAGESDTDLVITFSADRRLLDATLELNGWKKPEADLEVNLRSVIGPKQGWVLRGTTTRGKTPLAEVALVAEGNRIVIVDLDHSSKAEFRDIPEMQVVLNVTGDATPNDKTHSFRLMFGAGARSSRKPQGAGLLGIVARFHPAFLLSVARDTPAQATIRDGICEIHSGPFQFRLEADTGRLIELRFDEEKFGTKVSVRAESQALQAELRQLEEPIARAVAPYDPASPWKSASEFVIDASARLSERTGATERGQSLRALAKVLRNWSIPNLDDVLNAPYRDVPTVENRFWLPAHRHGFGFEDLFIPASRSQKNLAASSLEVWRRFAPDGSWLQLVGRDLLLNWVANDPAPARELQELVGAVETGPVAEMILGSLPSFLQLDLRGVAGRAGLARLSAADFANDYEPLLTEDSPLGRSFLSLAEALRQLDETELRALLRLLPDGVPRERITQALLVLQADRRSPVESVVPRTLDRLWLDVFRGGFETAFSRLAGLNDRPSNPFAELEIGPYDRNWPTRTASKEASPASSTKARRDSEIVPAAATSRATNDEPPAIPTPDPD